MKRNYKLFIQDITNAIKDIERFSGSMDYGSFITDEKTKSAVVWQIHNDRRFIEESFPVKEVSVESAKEKNIRHGHISTLHIWWAIDPIPTELIPTPCHDVDRPPMYGMKTWGDLFNSRQKLAMMTFVDKVNSSYIEMTKKDYEEEYAKAIASYLSLGISRQTDYNSSLCTWAVMGEFIAHTFGRQALTMVSDYFELCPWSNATGDWNSALDWISRVLEHLCYVPKAVIHEINHSSATKLTYPDNSFDAIFSHPPYYDNVGYANLSDFFLCLVKKSCWRFIPRIILHISNAQK